MLWGEGTMRKWWTAAAMAAMWLGQTAVSSAQGPGEVSGASAMPEPLPISGGPAAQNPMVAPPGYGPGMPGMPGMPGLAPGGPVEESGHSSMYFSSGALSLRRQRLGNTVSPFSGLATGQPLAVIDSGNRAIDTG